MKLIATLTSAAGLCWRRGRLWAWKHGEGDSNKRGAICRLRCCQGTECFLPSDREHLIAVIEASRLVLAILMTSTAYTARPPRDDEFREKGQQQSWSSVINIPI